MRPLVFLVVLKVHFFQSAIGINPFQFHINDFETEHPEEHYVNIRGKHFLKSGIPTGIHNSVPKISTGGEAEEDDTNTTSFLNPTPASWFPQCENHFHSNSESISDRVSLNSSCHPESKIWKQRYWINSQHYRAGGPIFFMFGGEGNAQGFVDAGIWMKFAQDFGAFVTCLEHRFYGESFPTLDTSFESMKLLTSQQALADAAMFIQWLKTNNSDQYSLLSAKVVAFGGSYPGNLAAWMRQKYPELINVAVASSAPVEARFEFPEFFRTVSEVIYQLDEICFWKLFKTFQCMDDLVHDRKCNETLSTKYTSKYELLTGLHQCEPYNFTVEYERQKFFHRLAVKWGSKQFRSASKCQTLRLQNSSDVIDDYGNFMIETGLANKSCTTSEKGVDGASRSPLSATNTITGDTEHNDETDEVVKFVKSLKGHARDGKSWTWQTCREFGYFQVADLTIQLFSDEWDSLIDITRCQTVFPDANFTRESIESRIKLTNEYYKGKQYDGSCTIFINGQWDPWHVLGFNRQNETSSKNTVISIPGAEHCEDMRNEPHPSHDMYEAQKKIYEQIGKYLNDPNC